MMRLTQDANWGEHEQLLKEVGQDGPSKFLDQQSTSFHMFLNTSGPFLKILNWGRNHGILHGVNDLVKPIFAGKRSRVGPLLDKEDENGVNEEKDPKQDQVHSSGEQGVEL